MGHVHWVQDRGILTGNQPMILLWLGIEPHSRADRQKLGLALPRLMAEDPSLAVKTNPDGIVMLGAPGDVQLDAAVGLLVDRFDVEAAVTAIEIAYKETLTQPADGASRHIMRAAGHGEYAHVKLRIEPGELGSGCVFENAIIGGAIPGPMLPFIEEGIDEVMDRGCSRWLSVGFAECGSATRIGATSAQPAFRSESTQLAARCIARIRPTCSTAFSGSRYSGWKLAASQILRSRGR